MLITAREMTQVLLKLPDPYTYTKGIINVRVPELIMRPKGTTAQTSRLVTFVKHSRNTERRMLHEWVLRVL